MSFAAVLFLSFSMSVDAFAVSIGRGTVHDGPRLAPALRAAMVFGIVEAITPFAGWLAGRAASDWVAHFDHWLAFGLLTAVGLHMIAGALRGEASASRTVGGSTLVLVATALGTSLDAMAVGLSLAFIDVDLAGIIVVSLGIGLATFLMATLGLLLGQVLGQRFGMVAEVVAGLVLCALGTMILVEHLGA